jgi:PEP-CTERM motif
MLLRSLVAAATAALVCLPASAQFVNGDFETGDATGWTSGTGTRAPVTNANLNPAEFLPGGSRYNPSLTHSAVVGSGVMAHTDGNLNQVYSGSYSYRAEDLTTGGFASVVTQRVNNYTDPNVFFAWAAVLEGAHGTNDAATFVLVLRDETLGTDLIRRTYNAASSGGGVDSRFALSTDGFYYTTQWQVEQLTLDATSLGHDISLTLLAADCQPTAHEGVVYLDGFGSVAPPPVPGVPEPETYALMLAGLGVVAFARRRQQRNKAN